MEKDDKITFEMSLDDPINKEEMLDVFRFDPEYEENEKMWKQIKMVRTSCLTRGERMEAGSGLTTPLGS